MAEYQLKIPKGAIRKKKILGRGPGMGKSGTCGRGHKGQKARSGGGVRPGFEGGQMPLYRRIARRGFSNARHTREYHIVNLSQIEQKYKDGETVNCQTLNQKNIINKKDVCIKILGQGDFSKKLNVDVDKISASALDKMKKAGCSIAETKPKEQAEEKSKKPKDKPSGEQEGKQ